jgi:hypothetical protein
MSALETHVTGKDNRTIWDFVICDRSVRTC